MDGLRGPKPQFGCGHVSRHMARAPDGGGTYTIPDLVGHIAVGVAPEVGLCELRVFLRV